MPDPSDRDKYLDENVPPPGRVNNLPPGISGDPFELIEFDMGLADLFDEALDGEPVVEGTANDGSVLDNFQPQGESEWSQELQCFEPLELFDPRTTLHDAQTQQPVVGGDQEPPNFPPQLGGSSNAFDFNVPTLNHEEPTCPDPLSSVSRSIPPAQNVLGRTYVPLRPKPIFSDMPSHGGQQTGQVIDLTNKAIESTAQCTEAVITKQKQCLENQTLELQPTKRIRQNPKGVPGTNCFSVQIQHKQTPRQNKSSRSKRSCARCSEQKLKVQRHHLAG